MNKKIITLLCIAGSLFSCNPEDKEKALQEDVLKIHDEAMLLMDELMRQKNKIQFKIDSLQMSGGAVENQIQNLRKGMTQLRRADSAMMTWMRQFVALPSDTVTHEQRMNYLKEEQRRIKKVHQIMVDAIEDAAEHE